MTMMKTTMHLVLKVVATATLLQYYASPLGVQAFVHSIPPPAVSRRFSSASGGERVPATTAITGCCGCTGQACNIGTILRMQSMVADAPEVVEEQEDALETADQVEKGAPPPPRKKRELLVSSSIELPFAAEVGYDAFANLTRQSEWSPWLHSVEYLELEQEDGTSRPASKWTLKVLGVSYSWISISTYEKRPTIIEWESVSGLKNFGKVQFVPHSPDSSDAEIGCSMTMTMTFCPPRIVAKIFSNRLKGFMEKRMIGYSLQLFRDAVSLAEEEDTLDEESTEDAL